MRRHRGTLAALVIAAAVLGVQARRHEPPQRYSRFELPAFDAHAYIAMAERPTVFSVAPWGYRLLTPALVHALPGRNVARGFRLVTFGALLASGGLLFLYLRRLGCGELPSLAAVAAFSGGGPVAEALGYRFLVEPLTLALELVVLLALQAGGGPGMLALLLALGTLSKEFALLLAPLLLLRDWPRHGPWRALVATAFAALPALVLTLLLRLVWTPYLAAPAPRLDAAALLVAAQRVAASWREWWAAALLAGLTPLALLGSLRERARPLRVPCAYLFGVVLVTPFLNPVTFFPRDVPRLLLYALPAVLPLALVAVDRVWPHLAPALSPEPGASAGPAAPGPDAASARGLVPARDLAAGLAALALAVAVPLVLDPYRRLDLQGPRDGPYALAFCRETLRTAGRLARGEAVAFVPAQMGFVWGESDPGDLGRMRWFLRDGWGERPHYGTGDVVMEASAAALVVPTLGGQGLEARLLLDAPGETPLAFSLGGRPVGTAVARPEPQTVSLALPADALVRGDNLLRLERAEDAPAPRLRAFELRPLP